MDFKLIEQKWQKEWEKSGIFKVNESKSKKKFYCLEMFPYPSGAFLHMGHVRNYSMGDVIARFKRMQGFNVLYPMGYDSFGLPAENAAKKEKIHPKIYTENAIKKIVEAQKALGNSYDWTRVIATHRPEYYKWNQYFFLKFLEKGLAYRKKAPVNFCPNCNTVLADEEVESGKCWRCETEVEMKELDQWFLKTTAYADELLEDLEKLDWSDQLKGMQRNWIGKSKGVEINFKIENKQKVILVDAVHCLVDEKGNVNKALKTYLDTFENKKIVLTNAPVGKHKLLFGGIKDYETFTLENNPNKKDSLYYKKFLEKSRLNPEQVIYFEHDKENVISAESAGIKTLHYEGDLNAVKNFLSNSLSEIWPIFTTRPDTIFGVTFMVISAQHPKLAKLVKGTKYEKKVLEFSDKCKKAKAREDIELLGKEGVFTGKYAENPLTGDKVPVWAGNFVVAEYGSGMVMAVPAHDQRDFEFAKKYEIPIKEVIRPVFGEKHENAEFRKTTSVVVHRKKDDKFLMLKWKQFGWIAPVIGGLDGEKLEKAAEREVLEETGYSVKFVKKLGGEIESHFFADNKNVWRHRVDQPVLVELLNETPGKVSEEEKKKHDVVWMTADEALNKITHEYNKLGILRYLKREGAYVDEGILVDSGKFTGVGSAEAIEKISDFIEKSKFGHRTTNYKLRDWLISRQRYWGTPIPIIYCEKCGAVPVPEKELPVLLPEDVKFGDKGNPLLTSKKFQEVKCPKCKGAAKRETDTMGGFMDSSWYFLRFCSPQEKNNAFKPESVGYWMPVDQYVGGIEHAVGHLIYARFFTKALRDLGFLKFDEPFSALFNQGIVYKDGKKMSKSFGNTVIPEEISSRCGIDTARLFLLFLASPEKQVEWTDEGIEGMSRFVRKVIALAENAKQNDTNASKKLEHYTNKAIIDVTDDIENFRFNLAIIKLMSFANYLEKENDKDSYEALLKLLSPFAPHITEELWHQIGNKTFISVENWPKANEKKIDDSFDIEEKLLDNIISDVREVMNLAKIAKPKKVIFIIADDWKSDFLKAVKLELEKTRNPGEIMKKIMANAALKKYGGDISKLVPKLVTDPGRIPMVLFGQKEELKIFSDAKSNLESEIGCKIEIVAEKDAKHPKSKQAMPGKPAIVVE
jgi:leucyl-tRNA synthetase